MKQTYISYVGKNFTQKKVLIFQILDLKVPLNISSLLSQWSSATTYFLYLWENELIKRTESKINKYSEAIFFYLIKSLRMSGKPEHSWYPDPEYFITQI